MHWKCVSRERVQIAARLSALLTCRPSPHAICCKATAVLDPFPRYVTSLTLIAAAGCRLVRFEFEILSACAAGSHSPAAPVRVQALPRQSLATTAASQWPES